MESLNNWLGHWEPFWLLLVLLFECALSMVMIYWMVREYKYDADKDLAKKQKRTKTTKKTTTQPTGESTVEEQTETIEPIGDSNENQKV